MRRHIILPLHEPIFNMTQTVTDDHRKANKTTMTTTLPTLNPYYALEVIITFQIQEEINENDNRFEHLIRFLRTTNQAEKIALEENPERIRDFPQKDRFELPHCRPDAFFSP